MAVCVIRFVRHPLKRIICNIFASYFTCTIIIIIVSTILFQHLYMLVFVNGQIHIHNIIALHNETYLTPCKGTGLHDRNLTSLPPTRFALSDAGPDDACCIHVYVCIYIYIYTYRCVIVCYSISYYCYTIS